MDLSVVDNKKIHILHVTCNILIDEFMDHLNLNTFLTLLHIRVLYEII